MSNQPLNIETLHDGLFVQDRELMRSCLQENTDGLAFEQIVNIVIVVADRDRPVEPDPPLEDSSMVVRQPGIRVDRLWHLWQGGKLRKAS
ncbi:MAG: hypothetical protein IPK19_23795 [Chloroflexi bacterium]|nr:hypothetical protein [Chloroflexota bacterium]